MAHRLSGCEGTASVSLHLQPPRLASPWLPNRTIEIQRTPALPSVRSLARLRPLLPYAAKLLPILTGIAAAGPRPDPEALDRHFGEIQSESRGLRTRVEGQGEQIERMAGRVEQIAASVERADRERAELSASLHRGASLARGLLFAILFLLVAVTTISILILLRLPHLS